MVILDRGRHGTNEIDGSTIMIRILALLSCISILGLCSCGLSVQRLVEMRAAPGDRTAAEYQAEILSSFETRAAAPIWRVEAMTTMGRLNNTYQHHLFHPELHRRMVAAIKQESYKPKVPSDALFPDVRHVRFWSVYTLSKLEVNGNLAYFLKVFEEQTPGSDPTLKISVAAANGILREMDAVWQNKGYRQRILSKCALLKAQLANWPRRGYDKRIWAFINALESKHLSYPDVVDMLEDENNAGAARLMEILRWDYEQLKTGKHKTNPIPIYNRNRKKLLELADHPNSGVRNRARMILTIFAPADLFQQLHRQLVNLDNPPEYDFEHTIELITRLDSGSPGAEYQAARKQVLDAYFAKLPKRRLKNREYIYARLLEIDPQRLATELIDATAKTLEQDNERLLQHVRFLAHCRNVDANRDRVPLLNRAIAECARKPSLPIRKAVVAYLFDQDPELVSAGHAAALAAGGNESDAELNYLVDAMIATLKKTTQVPNEQIRNGFSAALLTHNISVQKKAAAYFDDQSPNTFITLFSNALQKERAPKRDLRFREYALLGDFARKHKDGLNGEVRKQLFAALFTGIDARDEELALLCARPLLELGGTIPPGTLKTLPPSVRTLAELGGDLAKGE